MSCSLQDGSHALHAAVEKGHIDVINILVTHGANVDKVRILHNITIRYKNFMD